MQNTTETQTAEIAGGYGTVTVDSLKRHNGVAGQISVEISATYVWADDGSTEQGSSTLVGSSYGAPLVYVTAGGSQCFVTAPERFGSFSNDPIGYARRYVLGQEL